MFTDKEKIEILQKENTELRAELERIKNIRPQQSASQKWAIDEAIERLRTKAGSEWDRSLGEIVAEYHPFTKSTYNDILGHITAESLLPKTQWAEYMHTQSPDSNDIAATNFFHRCDEWKQLPQMLVPDANLERMLYSSGTYSWSDDGYKHIVQRIISSWIYNTNDSTIGKLIEALCMTGYEQHAERIIARK